MVAFIVDNGLVMARCPEWLQLSFQVLIAPIERIGLQTNAKKTKVMEEEYATQQTGTTATTKHRYVDYKVCGVSLLAESLKSHLETQHDFYRSFVFNRDIVPDRDAVVYHAVESPTTGIYSCPVPQCGGESGTRFNLCRHFLMQHPQDLVCIPIKGLQPLPKCDQCGLQMPVEDLSRGHHLTALCQRGWERKGQHVAAVNPNRHLDGHLQHTGRSWNKWKFSST
jgi:hypothetical protein